MTKRSIFFYFIVIGLFSLCLHWPTVIYETRAAVLNRLIPDYSYLTDYGEHWHPLDVTQVDWTEHENYYRQLLQYRPEYEEIHAMLGFVDYYQGRIPQAIARYRMALRGNQGYLWYNFNLGYILYQQNKFRPAAAFFRLATLSPVAENFHTVTMSRVFFPMMNINDEFKGKLKNRFRYAYRDSYMMLIYSLEQSGDWPAIKEHSETAVNQGLDQEGFFYYYAGKAALEMSLMDEGFKWVKELLVNYPEFTEGYRLLGEYYSRAGQTAGSEKALQKYLFIKQLYGEKLRSPDAFDLRMF